VKFEFATAGRIVFGPGTSAEAGRFAGEFGRRAFVLTGSQPDRLRPVLESLWRGAGAAGFFPVKGEPTIAAVEAAVRDARTAGCDVVVGIGGGSVLDAAKAVAALLANPGDVFEHLEVIGKGRPLESPALPCVAIPTTAGTGSEVTRNAVLGSPGHRLKVSLRHPSMLPRVALIDPELALELPPAITAGTGCDALAQLIEPFVCTRANPMTDGFCREGLVRVARSLRRACAHGDDLAARTDLAVASLLGGLALANAGLGAVHGLAGPIGGRFAAPHGAICGALLPHVMAVNLQAAEAAGRAEPLRERYAEVARLLTGAPGCGADVAVAWVRRLVAELGIPPLGAYGIAEGDLPEIAAAALKTSSMKANPVALTAEQCAAAARAALGPSGAASRC
jgi:alcohol dehydrogenase class IV